MQLAHSIRVRLALVFGLLFLLLIALGLESLGSLSDGEPERFDAIGEDECARVGRILHRHAVSP